MRIHCLSYGHGAENGHRQVTKGGDMLGHLNLEGVFMGLGWMEFLVIVMVILVLVGPSRLPKLGRALGDTVRGFKNELSGKKRERDVTNTLDTKDE